MKILHQQELGKVLSYSCPSCNSGLGFCVNLWSIDLFLTKKLRCEKCEHEFQTLDGFYHGFSFGVSEENDFFSIHAIQGLFELIGRKSTVAEYEIAPMARKLVDLSEVGVPSDAKVLSVRHQVSTHHQMVNAEPALRLANMPDKNEKLDKTFSVVGLPSGTQMQQRSATQRSASTKVEIWVEWLEHDDVTRYSTLYSSIKFLRDGHFSESLVAANTAVEMAMYSLCERAIQSFAKQKIVENFLSQHCNFSGQLNVLLPMIISINGLPEFPDTLLLKLNRLRKLRNEVAHKGKTKTPVPRREMLELLGSASISMHAFDVYLEAVAENKGRNANHAIAD